MVLATFDTSSKYITSNSNRLNFKNVNWQEAEIDLLSLTESLEKLMNVNVGPKLIYDKFILELSSVIESRGAFRPINHPGKKKSSLYGEMKTAKKPFSVEE